MLYMQEIQLHRDKIRDEKVKKFYDDLFFRFKDFYLIPINALEIIFGGFKMKFFRDITAISSFLLMVFLLIGCAPGKAQTRRDGEYQRYNDSRGKNSARYSDRSDYSKEQRDYDNENVTFNGEQDMEDERGASNGKGIAQEIREDDNFRYDEEEGNNRDSNYYGRQSNYYQKGTASWYGREFHGKVTASGEKFNMYEMTAAHKSLPFGTILLIKNLENGKEATVRINDRGPYRGNRIIDLSYNAAKKIGILAQGQGNVGISILKKGDGKYHSSNEVDGDDGRYIEPVADDSAEYENYQKDTGRFSIQAGAFYSRKNALNLQKRLESLTGRSVVIIQDDDMFKVRIEGITSREEAANHKRRLSEENISSFILDSRE
ncbi:MAG TPA: septal ring lytic transglycosylase RlpA family protein [Spirochaetota bacterium]|nr:septal ring lytic transglycosylase RlpA family protein [Spirochaetota bacterium]